LDRLETDPAFTCGFGRNIVRAFRKRMHLIRQAVDERDFRALRSWNFEKLKGGRSHQHSIRLNQQWRLIVEIVPAEPKNVIKIVAIEDYH
jgi:proteic killer suppression protein